MYIKFEKLKKDKKTRIIEIALKEFSDHGYVNTSTNEIVKKAGISKGALFNYFGSKKDLYFYLFEHNIKFMEEKLFDKLSSTESDFLVRLQEVTIAKMNLFKDNPDIYYFLIHFQKDLPPDLQSEFNKRSDMLKEANMNKLFENIDYTKFKEDIDIQKTIQIINWTLLSYSDEIMKKLKYESIPIENMDEYFKEVEEYIEVFRKTFYKN